MKDLAPVVRVRVVALLMIFMLAATGCVSIRRAPMQVPAGIQLTDPVTRLEGYKKLFPALPVLKTQQSELAVSRGRLAGKEPLIFLFTGADRNNLRLNISHQAGGPLFDVLIHDGQMSVVFYRSPEFPGAVFQGDAGDQTPFGRRFGFEPGDLIPIFEIGQTIATGNFEPAGSERRPLLVPANAETGGLQKIEIDPASGLPRRAEWRRPIQKRHWWSLRSTAKLHVAYTAWNQFKDEDMADEPARLMPASFTITSSAPKAVLDVTMTKGYRYSKTLPPKLFVVNIAPGASMHALSDLDEFFKHI